VDHRKVDSLLKVIWNTFRLSGNVYSIHRQSRSRSM